MFAVHKIIYQNSPTIKSQGTLIALASFSEGRLVDNLKSAALLSPVAYLTHMTTPLGILAARAFVGEVSFSFSLIHNHDHIKLNPS